MRVPVFLLLVLSLAQGANLGSDVCAGCHKSIAAAQAGTAMARTWQALETERFPKNYSAQQVEGPDPAIQYRVGRSAAAWRFEVQMPGEQGLKFPIEKILGGERHGFSFLLRVQDLAGVRLPRAPLVEARYLHYAPENHLELSPGFPKDKPATYESALGRVLTPGFEKKCLACHGAPRKYGGRIETGVGCESCHGPGQAHLIALGKKSADKGILNPARLPKQDQMKPCAQCHSGFSMVEDPLPDDLLISEQVTALSNTECWRQSGGQIACTGCHNPHEDAPRAVVIARSEKTCLGCHSVTVSNHAGVCPVNQTSGCVGCHMPESRKRAPFVITDHWIRVHPGQNVSARKQDSWRSTVTPKHLYLRAIMLEDRGKAAEIRQQLVNGGSFFDLARANSIHRGSAENGGFLGDLDATQLDEEWSKVALALAPGEISDVAEIHGQYVIVQRMPRNFREEAGARFQKAMALRKLGKREESTVELLEALKVYPWLLRALTYLGMTYGEAGNPEIGAKVLNIATEVYPQDAGAHFNLGITYRAMRKDEEIAEYKRALEIDPDMVLGYLNWGGALYVKGKYEEAVRVYREGIRVNPLFASLHYSLSLALTQMHKAEEAEAEMQLALKIDPKIAKR